MQHVRGFDRREVWAPRFTALCPVGHVCVTRPEPPRQEVPSASPASSRHTTSIVHRRTLLLAPLASVANEAWPATEAPAPQNPFAGLEQKIAADATDVESVVVTRDQRVLFDYAKAGAHADTLRDVQSVTKSVLSITVGVALGRGVLRSIDESVSGLVTRAGTISERAAATKLTLAHLLSMTAGFAPTGRVTRRQSDDPLFLLERERAAEPGTTFHYDNHATNLLSCALGSAVGMPVSAFARSSLFEPLGIQAFEWNTGPNGHAYGASGLKLRTRDMARLGQLMLDRGSWQGNQLVPASFVGEALKPHSAGGAPVGLPYGYGWWMTPSQQEARTFFASGFGGQFIWVHVPLGLVIAITSEVSGQSNARGQALALIRNELFAAASAWRPT
jgi:CubicO group peptidase (beta-lactamase class C family)